MSKFKIEWEEVKKQGMESLFCPYEQALALKELGFDEPCFGYYSNGDLVYGNHTNNIIQRFRYSAPLYQQAFRWFREKHGWLQIIIGEGLNGNLNGYGYSILEEGWINFYDSLDESVIYETYEEAELACLKKLIKIVNER